MSDTTLPSRDLSRRRFLAGSAAAGLTVTMAGALPTAALAAGPSFDLASGVFDVRIDQATGAIHTLVNPADGLRTNYVANPTSRPAFDINDSRWTGDVLLNVRRASATAGTPMTTSLSDDIRQVTSSAAGVQVTYAGTPANANGIRGLSLTSAYSLTGTARDRLSWTITLKNTSTEALEIQDLGFPVLMNAFWNAGDQTGIYEQNVGRHSFVGKDGSYVYWQRPNGVGPYLVMTPQPGTGLEFKNKAGEGEGPFGEVTPSFEGVVEFYIHSKAVAFARRNDAAQYLPATSTTLAPGAERTWGFTFRWAGDYKDLRDVLFDAGVVDVVSLPGMVIPQDTAATLAVRAKDGITGVVAQGTQTTITPRGTRNGYQLYELRFTGLGPRFVTVQYGTGRESVLQYASMRPIEELIESRTTFLTTKQQARTTRGYDGAYLQWDMTRERLITWDDYPPGGWKEWMAGGSDDLGLGPAVFLAEKNLRSPKQAEITSIDYYLQNFILGYMQSRTENGQRTWQVYRWYDGRDDTPNDQQVWRAYNYVHIANTYYLMYQVKKAYPALTTAFTPAQYLDMAYQTLNAMFTKIPLPTPIGDAARIHGMMGESTYPDILAALDAEGQTTQSARLRSLIEAKRDYLFGQEYPFASEMSIDTTGFESNYTLAKTYGNRALADKCMTASLACRGMQPLWYFYGSDNRHMGESWWNLGYECQLGAWQQQDYLSTYAAPTDRDFDDAMRSTYGAWLAGWALINSGQISPAAVNTGAAAWIFQSEKGAIANYSNIPILDGWWAWSGEADLGFWGGLRSASVNVVDDDVVGLYAYGGDLTLTSGVQTIVPKDGVRTAFTMYNLGTLGVQLARTRYTRAEVATDRSRITLTLQNVSGGTYSPRITVTNLPAGSYAVSVDGAVTGTQLVSDGRRATVEVPGLTGASSVVALTAQTNVAGAAAAAASFTAAWNRVGGLNDGAQPTTSRDVSPNDNATTWGAYPQVSQQWVEYTWPAVRSLRRVGVYFVDNLDANGNGITVPASWSVQWWDAGTSTWRAVAGASGYPTAANTYNTATFTPVTTTKLRLVLNARGTVSGKGSLGIKEWQVF
ncbi:DUF5695 domain-containing protein [Modestobacter sp. Leaf380]|uniref:DUF5695 domain-containing protein n=1 Tax=Modestobacter sp. Leaf380 TaxID=1736356 RepID=UPI0006FA5EAA|nr:DUF5695 domain-containing protein [Modestobacter sp. Leaf380]KQS66712.1 hypothetical protein ASG41_09725 [Modestobacter sp. Leaf380]